MSTGFALSDPGEAEYLDLLARFGPHNAQHTDWRRTTFCLVRRDSAGRIVAGGQGIVNLGLVEIRALWVDAGLRGQGVGSALLAALETEGARRGATRAALDTYGWQALDFYLRHGYREFGRLAYPNGTARIWLAKDLDGP